MRRSWASVVRLGILGAVGFLTAFGAHIIVIGLPAYGRRHGLGYWAIGLLLASYNLAEIVAKPLVGTLIDRVGPRLVMAWGTIFFALSCLAYQILPPDSLGGLRVCQGLGAGALSVSSLVMVAKGFPERLGGAFGTYNALKGCGYVCAPLAGGLLGAASGLRGAFLLAGLAGIAVLVLQVAAGPTLAGPARMTTPGPAGRRVMMWPWYLANFTDMALLGILLGFLPVRADRLGYGTHAATLLLCGATVSYLVAQPLLGSAADRLGRRQLVLAGMALASLGTALLGLTAGAGLFCFATLAGLGLGAAWTNSLARVGEGASRDRMGGDLGLAGSFKDAGDIGGPLLLGFLAGRLGLGPAFLACGVLGACVATLVAWATRGEHALATLPG